MIKEFVCEHCGRKNRIFTTNEPIIKQLLDKDIKKYFPELQIFIDNKGKRGKEYYINVPESIRDKFKDYCRFQIKLDNFAVNKNNNTYTLIEVKSNEAIWKDLQQVLFYRETVKEVFKKETFVILIAKSFSNIVFEYSSLLGINLYQYIRLIEQNEILLKQIKPIISKFTLFNNDEEFFQYIFKMEHDKITNSLIIPELNKQTDLTQTTIDLF